MRTEAPLRCVDVGSDSAAGLTLNARIDVVPTAVVVRDGREIDRIVGLLGAQQLLPAAVPHPGQTGGATRLGEQ